MTIFIYNHHIFIVQDTGLLNVQVRLKSNPLVLHSKSVLTDFVADNRLDCQHVLSTILRKMAYYAVECFITFDYDSFSCKY